MEAGTIRSLRTVPGLAQSLGYPDLVPKWLALQVARDMLSRALAASGPLTVKQAAERVSPKKIYDPVEKGKIRSNIPAKGSD